MIVPSWTKCNYHEFPDDNRLVWVTDGKVVRKGTWAPNEPMSEDWVGVWRDEAGAPIIVTHWMFLEESPDSPPTLPTAATTI